MELGRPGSEASVAEALERPVVQVPVGGSISAGSVSASTAKPWFCDVIATWPVAGPATGWFAPRWPNFSLKVFAPSARPSSWWPRQIPKIGFAVGRASIVRIGAGERRRIAGPLERKMPSGRLEDLAAPARRREDRHAAGPACSRRTMLRFMP
jgi:hypothetical protein